MNGIKKITYASVSLEDKKSLSESTGSRSAQMVSDHTKPDSNEIDKWFIGFDSKQSISVPKNSVPKPLLDVLKKPKVMPEGAVKSEYDRSKFLLTGLHAGDESRVEIALLGEGVGGGFADVMPGKNGFVITVPELFEFRDKAFTAEEFLLAVNAAKAQFQIRGHSVEETVDRAGEKR